jgi:16S rRNA (guanine527-N7)-methyltransferase
MSSNRNSEFPVTAITQLLSQALAENDYDFPSNIQQQLIDYLSLLYRWNQITNLTAIRDPQEMVFQHVLDSLTVLPYLTGTQFIDVGSGAGLPGIPLAITQPDKIFFLLDSNNKKTVFLQQVVLTLGLKNVTVIHSRCEQYQPDELFDAVLTRAFSSLKNMLMSTQHLIKPTGEFLAMKGVYPEDEIKNIPNEFQMIAHPTLKIKNWVQHRCLIIFKRAMPA